MWKEVNHMSKRAINNDMRINQLRYRAGVRSSHNISKENMDKIDAELNELVAAVASGKKMKRGKQSVAASGRKSKVKAA